MQTNPYGQYKQVSIQTASREQLLLMLYDGAIKFLRQAKDAVNEKNFEKVNLYISRTQDIINELMFSLDMGAGEIASSLWKIYDYWNHRLIQANLKKDAAIIEEILGLVQEMRDAWGEAAVKCKENNGDTSGGVNIEG